MKTIRSFIALNVDVALIRRVADLQKELQSRTVSAGLKLKWVPPQNMHVTLRYLGAITEPMIAALKDNVSMVTRQTPPFEFSLKGLGVFPDFEDPRVLHIGAHDGSSIMDNLYNGISDILTSTGFKTEERPYFPHVTLARMSSADGTSIQQIIETFDSVDPGVSSAHDVLCYASEMKTNRTDYHLLWHLPLLGRKKPEDVAYDAPPDAQGVQS